MPELDPADIRHALKTAQECGLRVVRLKAGDASFSAQLPAAGFEPEMEFERADELELPKLDVDPEQVAVTSPVVGYFREAKTPLSVGTTVAEGERIGEIVALGIANELVAPCAGEIVEVGVSPGEAVDYGRTIATLRRTE